MEMKAVLWGQIMEQPFKISLLTFGYVVHISKYTARRNAPEYDGVYPWLLARRGSPFSRVEDLEDIQRRTCGVGWMDVQYRIVQANRCSKVRSTSEQLGSVVYPSTIARYLAFFSFAT